MTEHLRLDGRRLGRRPPSAKPVLAARSFLRSGAVPTVPNAVDHLAGFEYELGKNDRFGTCGPTSVANYVRLVTTALTGATIKPTWDDIKRLYKFQNPTFDENTGAGDEGVDMKTMLSDAIKHGFVQAPGGPKVLGFASVDVSNPEEVEAAVAIFGGVLLGVDLQTAQQAQTDAGGPWDYSPSGEWGGHAICEGAYEANENEDVITWAQRVAMTRNFSVHQREEAYVVILDAHLGSKEFMAGWDLQQFAQAYTDITGRPFPATIPVTPPVTPPITPPEPPQPPLPGSLGIAVQALTQSGDVAAFLAQRHSGLTKRVAALVRAVINAAPGR